MTLRELNLKFSNTFSSNVFRPLIFQQYLEVFVKKFVKFIPKVNGTLILLFKIMSGPKNSNRCRAPNTEK